MQPHHPKLTPAAGSYALVGAKVPRDATVAKKLRAAGVVILGKTNLSQWANWRSHNSSNGWSAYGGSVTAAYYPNQDPSGSSSGSGVASSIGLALATLGTEVCTKPAGTRGHGADIDGRLTDPSSPHPRGII